MVNQEEKQEVEFWDEESEKTKEEKKIEREKKAREFKQRAKPKVNLDGEKVRDGLAQLILTVVELLRELMEKQAIRKMIFTKTQIAILKIFCSRINESFTIKKVAEKIKQNYSIVYSALQDLYKNKFLTKDKHKNFTLNYKENPNELAYIESLRAEEFLKKHKDIALFINEVINKTNLGFFSLLLFGSYVEKPTKKSDTEISDKISVSKTLKIKERVSDIDILMIIENLEDVEKIEKQIKNMSEKYGNPEISASQTLKNKQRVSDFDINVISKESVKEMLTKKEKLNVINETLNRHILFFGAEDYYRLINII